MRYDAKDYVFINSNKIPNFIDKCNKAVVKIDKHNENQKKIYLKHQIEVLNSRCKIKKWFDFIFASMPKFFDQSNIMDAINKGWDVGYFGDHGYCRFYRGLQVKDACKEYAQCYKDDHVGEFMIKVEMMDWINHWAYDVEEDNYG